MPEYKEVTVRSGGGNVSIELDTPDDPQLIYGRIWRYTLAKDADGKAGNFSTAEPVVDLGPAASVIDRIFVATGIVIAHGDNPPSRYRVVVTVKQDGLAVYGPETVTDKGEGRVGAKDAPFTQHLIVRRAP